MSPGEGVIVPTGPGVSNRGGDQEEPSELGYTDLLLSGSQWNQHVSASHSPPLCRLLHIYIL